MKVFCQGMFEVEHERTECVLYRVVLMWRCPVCGGQIRDEDAYNKIPAPYRKAMDLDGALAMIDCADVYVIFGANVLFDVEYPRIPKEVKDEHTD